MLTTIGIIALVVFVVSAIAFERAYNNRLRWPMSSNGGLAVVSLVLMIVSLYTISFTGLKQRQLDNLKKKSETYLQAP